MQISYTWNEKRPDNNQEIEIYDHHALVWHTGMTYFSPGIISWPFPEDDLEVNNIKDTFPKWRTAKQG